MGLIGIFVMFEGEVLRWTDLLAKFLSFASASGF